MCDIYVLALSAGPFPVNTELKRYTCLSGVKCHCLQPLHVLCTVYLYTLVKNQIWMKCWGRDYSVTFRFKLTLGEMTYNLGTSKDYTEGSISVFMKDSGGISLQKRQNPA